MIIRIHSSVTVKSCHVNWLQVNSVRNVSIYGFQFLVFKSALQYIFCWINLHGAALKMARRLMFVKWCLVWSMFAQCLHCPAIPLCRDAGDSCCKDDERLFQALVIIYHSHSLNHCKNSKFYEQRVFFIEIHL